MTHREFQRMISIDNNNIDSMLRAYIGESANAAVIATYDDAIVLCDTVNEDIYTAKYYFDPNSFNVILEDFDKVELEDEDRADFKMAFKDFLLGEEQEMSGLVNEYRRSIEQPKNEINKIISEAVADKDYSRTADFEDLSFINEEFNDLRNEDFFKDYQQRLISNPLPDVLYFNWKDPVAFSLHESTEPDKYINSKGKEKARLLVKGKKFKKDACKACAVFKEDVEAGSEELLNLFEEYPSLFYLNQNEIKEAFAKAVVTDAELHESYKSLLEGIKEFINTNEDFIEMKEAIDIDDDSESSDGPNDDTEDKSEKPEDDDTEEKKEKKARELTQAEKEKLVSALKAVVEKSVDEKIQDMAQKLIDEFDVEDDGTKPEVVKEAVRLLSY